MPLFVPFAPAILIYADLEVLNSLDNYEEMEWRLVYGESSDRSGIFTNAERHIHRVKFDPKDVKLIVFPDDKVRQQTLVDDEMKGFFAAYQPDMVLLEDCIHF